MIVRENDPLFRPEWSIVRMVPFQTRADRSWERSPCHIRSDHPWEWALCPVKNVRARKWLVLRQSWRRWSDPMWMTGEFWHNERGQSENYFRWKIIYMTSYAGWMNIWKESVNGLQNCICPVSIKLHCKFVESLFISLSARQLT
jgi:hypothetical protein